MNKVQELYDLIGDQLNDPEPQYVEGLSNVPHSVLLCTQKQLQAVLHFSHRDYVYPGSDCQV